MKAFLASLAWFVAATILHAYEYPIGIPAAWIAPDVARPARPATWTSEVPGYYYVNEATGTNTSRTYGTPTAPRRSLPPNPIPAGSYIEVAGTYSQTTSGVITVVKAAGNTNAWIANTDGPVWLVGLDAANRASFFSKLLLEGSGLCAEYIDNLAGHQSFEINSAAAAAMRTATYMLFRNCELDGNHTNNGTAIVINGSTFSTSSDIIIYNNVVHGYGPLVPDIDRDCVGIFVHNYTERVWVLDNHCYELAGSGVGISTQTGSPSRTNYVYCGRNHIHNTWAVGVSLKGSNHVVITENHIHDSVYTSWSQAKGIGAQYAALDTWILYNRIHDCDYGIRLGSTNGVGETIHVIGNLVYNIRAVPGGVYGGGGFAPAAIALWGGDNRFVIGNTVANSDRGFATPEGGALPYGTIVEHNVFSNITNEHVYVALEISTPTVSRNLFNQPGGSPVIRFANTFHTFATLTAAGRGTDNVTADPLFVDAATGNFRAQAETPLLSAVTMTRNVFADFPGIFTLSLPLRTYSDLVDVPPNAPSALIVSP